MKPNLADTIAEYQESDNCKRRFAQKAAYHPPEDVQALADGIRRSVQTVKELISAYRLYHLLYAMYEDDEIIELWETQPPQIWVTAARVTRLYDLLEETILTHLREARDKRLSVDAFRDYVDDKENPTPKWQRTLLSGVKSISRFDEKYISRNGDQELPPHVIKGVSRAVEVFLKILFHYVPELERELKE